MKKRNFLLALILTALRAATRAILSSRWTF